jgi:hypothetical protein
MHRDPAHQWLRALQTGPVGAKLARDAVGVPEGPIAGKPELVK